MSITVKVRCPRFVSKGDEEHFFEWLQSIPGVGAVKGSGRSLLIDVREKTLPRASFTELAGLFERYRISKRGLKQVAGNRSRWSTNLFWFDDVFG